MNPKQYNSVDFLTSKLFVPFGSTKGKRDFLMRISDPGAEFASYGQAKEAHTLDAQVNRLEKYSTNVLWGNNREGDVEKAIKKLNDDLTKQLGTKHEVNPKMDSKEIARRNINHLAAKINARFADEVVKFSDFLATYRQEALKIVAKLADELGLQKDPETFQPSVDARVNFVSQEYKDRVSR